ncbi:MAG: shikimate dehydrogenase [Actinobacteria bacterium 13_1_20CM_2_65_11]|nr:MAG: shikimate dehydrogenase [Chloroflexi bacterium 13_1_40CM_65_17]OLC63774.1 MAG: shikimate dehydrogenase [Actinobacteria bacterium 13_1_40CM_4_65_12]OLD25530.1 MAG: shikimate dehydrogenase [Chloroflexi bacterium 13_1_40CM_3_65_12]OLE77973.1 MAG: shikimate dehydrogenase [Actinobacteria bacterium 13_1_20CM_2_65_11]
MDTLYFVGVTTGQSAATRLFPAWANELGLKDVGLAGADLPIHAPRELYRDLVQRIKSDEHTRGALVTTHKIDLFEACRDLFDTIDESADLCGETSCLSKPGGMLCAQATDPISAGKALDEFLPADHFHTTDGHVLCLGAGGSAIAITLNLLRRYSPARITVVNRSQGRLDAMRAVHTKLNSATKVDYICNADPPANDQIIRDLPPGSLVINATGMGKDTPGSPITDDALFPENGVVWELNYRGELRFLKQALVQSPSRGLRVHDGWRYFLHGWATVIEEVFDLTINAHQLTRLAALSEPERPPRAEA